MKVHSPLLKENKQFILENTKQAKQYIERGDLSEEEFAKLVEIDPSPKRKFVGWMAKQWINGNITDESVLKNTIEEYHTFLERGKAKTKDIYQFKTFDDLKNEIDELNKSTDTLSLKEMEEDFEVVLDDENLLIVVPHSHEASRKLGLSEFAYRECGDGTMDSTWCTTFKSPDHFENYYYSRGITFYYVKVKPGSLRNEIIDKFGEEFVVTAILVYDDGKTELVDGMDRTASNSTMEKFLDVIGIS
jgi:hypothetical protein